MRDLLKNRKYLIAAVIAVVVVVIGIILILNRPRKEEPVSKEKVYQVSVMEAGETGSDVTLSYAGIIQPEVIEQATFASVGTVKEIYVKNGQSVRAGDPLVKLDDEDALRQLENTENTLKRSQEAEESARERRDSARKDYNEACTPKKEKEALDDAIKRRDAQKKRVEKLKKELDEIDKGTSGGKNNNDNKNNTGDKNSSGSNSNSLTNSVVGTATTDYWYKQQQLVAAQETLETYNQSVNAAQEAYDKKKKEGADSSDAKAQKERLDAAEDNLENAESVRESAQNNYESAQKAVEDCTLRARNDGYVIEVEVTEGAVSTPIMPAVVLGSHSMVASFGVSQSDIMELNAGMAATVTVGGNTYSGRIKESALMPDETSRTYTTSVTLDAANAELNLGELATVEINIGERRGIWLPLSVILNDGEDYVYIVVDGRAKRQYVTIEEMKNDMVMVSGTKAGDQIICEGMKLIRTGSAVSSDGQ